MTVLDQNGVAMGISESWARPAWTVRDPQVAHMSSDGHLDPLEHATTEVRVSFAGLNARTGVRVNPRSLVLSAPAFYMTQGVQNSDGSVPLIAGRQALLRVFVTGDQGSFYQPRVYALFYHGDKLAHGAIMTLDANGLPTEVEEGRLDRSYNVTIPGWVIRPGTTMVIELDRDGIVPASPASQLRIPATGRLTLDVRPVPRLELTIVPIVNASDPYQEIYEWTKDITIDSDHLRLARSILPIGAIGLKVHEGFVTSADLTTGAGWGELLGDLTFLRIDEGERGYYYGAVVLGEGVRWDGLGYIGYPVGIGAADSGTLAHEIGHNLSLRHAPCGGAADPDPEYPYDGGAIGVWGYDFHEGRIVDSFLYRDFMGYCKPYWISDYHFKRALHFRQEAEAMVLRGSSVAPPVLSGDGAGLTPAAGPWSSSEGKPSSGGKTMLLWGRAGGGELVLDPAFMVDLPVTLPEAEGPYRLTGVGPAGEHRFSLSFTPRPTEFGGGHFLFAIPFDPNLDGALDQVVLSGPEGSFTLERSGAKPMAIVTDRGTGRVRGILRDWTAAQSRRDSATAW